MVFSTVTVPLSYKSKLIGQHIGIRCYTSYTTCQVTKRKRKDRSESHCPKFYILSRHNNQDSLGFTEIAVIDNKDIRQLE